MDNLRRRKKLEIIKRKYFNMSSKEKIFYRFNPRFKLNKEKPILKSIKYFYSNNLKLKKKSNSFDIFKSNLKKIDKIEKKKKPLMFFAFRFLSEQVFCEKIFKS